MLLTSRTSGVLLHPTSLPGPYGVGELGSTAYRFIDFLTQSGQSWWQVLPLGPTAKGHSPYTPFSTAAGNHLLISLELLARQGLLSIEDLNGAPGTFPDRVDFERLDAWKTRLLRKAFACYRTDTDLFEQERLEGFCQAKSTWLDDYALFMAYRIKSSIPWTDWPKGIRLREADALRRARRELSEDIAFQQFLQYQFWTQWTDLKAYANMRGIGVIGDLPFYVAHDSADMWAHSECFDLDPETRKPLAVAGVPPDYFSATGQLWGNPLYDWEQLEQTGFRWWLWRIDELLTQADLLRLDHFRGLLGYWEIPATEATAINGRWRKAPGYALLEAIRERLGRLPIIAEDLGIIGADVIAFRDHFGLPGMKILHFAFDGDPHNAYLPHNVGINSVIYTGTHDNNTTVGWLQQDATPEQKACLSHYLPRPTGSIARDLMRMAFGSPATLVITPFQDLIDAGAEARMNIPSVPEGNWSWRCREGDFNDTLELELRELTRLYARCREPGL